MDTVTQAVAAVPAYGYFQHWRFRASELELWMGTQVTLRIGPSLNQSQANCTGLVECRRIGLFPQQKSWGPVELGAHVSP
jgi:hypothetical protein